MSNQKGIEQGRAKFAYECAKKGSELGKEYKSHVRKIPMMIKTNGLGATFAFVYSKSKKDKVYKKIYEQTWKWLLKEKEVDITDFEKLAVKIVSCDSPEYRMLTIETLAFFNWLRRFADGLIEGED